MRGMIRTLERYVDSKKLVVNAEKSKIMKCRKGGGRKTKMAWIEGKRVGGGGQIHVPELRVKGEWRLGSAYERENSKRGKNPGASVGRQGFRKKEVW